MLQCKLPKHHAASLQPEQLQTECPCFPISQPHSHTENCFVQHGYCRKGQSNGDFPSRPEWLHARPANSWSSFHCCCRLEIHVRWNWSLPILLKPCLTEFHNLQDCTPVYWCGPISFLISLKNNSPDTKVFILKKKKKKDNISWVLRSGADFLLKTLQT